MVGLEVQILVSVSLLPVHSEGTIRVVGNQSVKEGELPILLRLHNELDVWLNRVKMRGEGWDLFRGKGSTCVIYIAFPEWGRGWVGCQGSSFSIFHHQ